ELNDAIFAQKSKQQMLRLDVGRPELTGLVAREKDYPASLLCVTLKHNYAPLGFAGFCLADEKGRLNNLAGSLLQPRDLGHDRRCLFFERRAHGLIVDVRHLAGFVFEIQIAQVLVDRFLALAEIAEPRLLFSGVDFARKKENVIETGERNGATDESNHKSVSLRALRRNSSSSLPRGMVMPSARAGSGRFFHERTT